MHNKVKRQNLAFFSVLLLVLFSWPFIGLADKPLMVKGIPLLYLYILVVWILTIVIMYRLTAARRKKTDE
ncbi:MAG: hypothetical protein U0V75_15040 [Ferruginibacter sp.]